MRSLLAELRKGVGQGSVSHPRLKVSAAAMHRGACIHKSEEAEEYIVYPWITLHGGTGWSGRLRLGFAGLLPSPLHRHTESRHAPHMVAN